LEDLQIPAAIAKTFQGVLSWYPYWNVLFNKKMGLSKIKIKVEHVMSV
jgi:hypothetical protein